MKEWASGFGMLRVAMVSGWCKNMVLTDGVGIACSVLYAIDTCRDSTFYSVYANQLELLVILPGSVWWFKWGNLSF